MLRCHNHEGYAEKRIAARCIDLELLIGAGNLEIDESAGGAADPVDLLLFDIIRKIDKIESVEKFICIIGNLQIPYILRELDDVAVADIALASLGVLIRKDNLAGWTVIDERLGPEYESVLKELEEDPLGPFIIFRIAGADLAVPVEGESDRSELIGKVLDVLLRDNSRMSIRLDGVILRRQTESVKADREKDVVALHSSLSGDDFDT